MLASEGGNKWLINGTALSTQASDIENIPIENIRGNLIGIFPSVIKSWASIKRKP
jgi:hypothetical protein